MAEELRLEFNFPGGAGEVEVGLDHPTVAPLRRALSTGKPPGQWAWLLARDEFSGIWKLLGSFARSPGNRFLYFSGSSSSISDTPRREDAESFDHLSLDPPAAKGKHASHVTTKSGRRGSVYRSVPPSGHLFPWFSFLTPSLAQHVTMPERLHVRFPPPRPDLKEFGDLIVKSPSLAEVLLPAAPANSFFQLDVWASWEPNWRELAARPLPWAYKSGFVTDVPPEKQNVTVSEAAIPFGDAAGLRVLCSRPHGTLESRHILRPTLSR